MKASRRIRILKALIASHEAATQALRMYLEEEPASSEPSPPPPNVIREQDKTGPRTPFRFPEGDPSRRVTKPDTTYAVNKHTALGHLKRLYSEAESIEDRVELRTMARQLRDMQLLTKDEIAPYLDEEDQ